MRVRRLVDETAGTTRARRVVWFGSYGKTTKLDANGNIITHPEVQEDGTVVQVPTMFAKFVNPNNKHDNFSSENEMVRDSLIQRLSVIRHELWYDYQFGMPLVDSDIAQVQIDAFVMQTITQHQDVIAIQRFKSRVEGHHYTCDVEFTTKFGSVKISL